MHASKSVSMYVCMYYKPTEAKQHRVQASRHTYLKMSSSLDPARESLHGCLHEANCRERSGLFYRRATDGPEDNPGDECKQVQHCLQDKLTEPLHDDDDREG